MGPAAIVRSETMTKLGQLCCYLTEDWTKNSKAGVFFTASPGAPGHTQAAKRIRLTFYLDSLVIEPYLPHNNNGIIQPFLFLIRTVRKVSY